MDFFKTWFRSQHANSIRERKKNASNQAFERIGTEFHRWLRDDREKVGLHKSDDFVTFVHRDFMFFSREYIRVRNAAETKDSEWYTHQVQPAINRWEYEVSEVCRRCPGGQPTSRMQTQ